MNEAETRAELIDPALREAGWGVVAESRTRREVIAPGRIMGKGKRASPLSCDYVLVYRNTKLATIEAKAATKSYTEGVGQAKDYAARLLTRFAFATNGKEIYRIDMQTGAEGPVDTFPTPQALWDATFAAANVWRDRFAAVAYETSGGRFEPRYYQHNAIERVLEAISHNRDRILLTLATGTGKTAIAFQIAWKLFHARWNLGDWKAGCEPTRRPRILFLADRNILADQAYNSFSAFDDGALARVKPDEIKKKGAVPKNASVFFTIFQTFTSGTDADGEPAPYFGDYPPDFFDCIIIDECHRGGAKDESKWRATLEYFAPAVQIGLTATPKRTNNVDTYAYFGEPVYTYSLKEGINDGYLTPFKVRQIGTTIDEYVYTPDDSVIEGEVESGRRYTEGDFNRVIEIPEREAYRVKTFMDMIDQREKTIVFCASQPHAGIVRDLINQVKSSTNPNYCVRVTAADGVIGDQWLRTFQDNDKTIPTILTTSQKLSTGVDARNVRNIVLMRPVKSMIEFKQIIGRGTRLFDGKDYFTVLDFVKAYEHFNDPEWDGDPLEPEPPGAPRPRPGPGEPDDPPPPPESPEEPTAKLRIKLADGKERTFQHISATTFWDASGKPISAQQFIEALFGKLPELFKDEDELRAIWSQPDTRRNLIEGLAERGFGGEQLDAIRRATDAQESDLFDVLAYIAFLRPPLKRTERVDANRDAILSQCEPRQREFLDFVLAQYVQVGESELDSDKLPELLQLKYGSPADAVRELGGVAEIRSTFHGFQAGLYEQND
ncbi:MAG: DEAD/DEAH box helicase family protein [Alphaproteobacteria bacterium]|nr:DEAD/DEAH box helicase family protein [Alphaproteobacteria bacterium]MBU1513251.1 DEAD/DEAH box helicase family protein [Alphaproteobacteria bacterium]MBU2095359.1 DEAD/DEAH box helicase family protein [Alphaproteobacteria bacterium]MBU2152274.1 DEAD/DEAH box helicase family protein [Alphaproteobacteria bacterium]MBU2306679.1 DEAD/DEAH box helicase family protein [Alphaproteobacteria bacterium]